MLNCDGDHLLESLPYRYMQPPCLAVVHGLTQWVPAVSKLDNTNSNNNTQDNVYSAVIMTKSFREFTWFIW